MINQRIVQVVEEVVDVVVVGVIVSRLCVGWAVFDECLPTCVGV